MTIRIKPALAGLLLTLCSCATLPLVQLQSSYDTLRTREGPQGEATSDEVRAGFILVAQDAMGMAGKAKERATNIAILRLAAVSAWRAQDRDYRNGEAGSLAFAAAEKGKQLCGTVSAREFGAPRDCALLRIIPTLVQYDALEGRLPTAPLDTMNPAKNRQYAEGVATYTRALVALAREATAAWTEIKSGTGAYEGVSPGVIDYVNYQYGSAACKAYEVNNALQAIAGQDPTNVETAQAVLGQLGPAMSLYTPNAPMAGCGLLEGGKKPLLP